MKVKDLINNLEKVRQEFIETNGVEPSIFSVDEDEGTLICANIVKNGCLRTAKKPYIYKKTGLEKLK